MMNNSDTKDYLRYWGKARPAGEQQNSEACHLLAYHSLDVAAVGYCLMSPKLSATQSLASELGVAPGQLQAIFAYLMSIHDLGKFSQSFQGLAYPDVSLLVKPDSTFSYDIRGGHAALGMVLWKQSAVFTENVVSICNWPDESGPRRKARRALELLLGTAFGHHGQPVDSGSELPESYFLLEDMDAARSFATEMAGLLAPQWPTLAMMDEEWGDRLKQLSWQLAGQAVLADWLGSDQSAFPYLAEPIPLKDYWLERALPQARWQLERLGFGKHLKPAPFQSVESFFGFEPTPLQQWAEQAPVADSPQLFILEDVTGAGKTEAAVTLTHRLMANDKASGVYFGLPTMATSNAMYRRIAAYYHRWYADGKRPNLVLAHGARQLQENFQTSIVPVQRSDLNYLAKERSASAVCNQWFADSRKKALLADVGVGTIDQVLMGVLPFRHQSLRLIGLNNKVLIVDEIHACDDYMLTLLNAALEMHARQGGYAILLTATLPLVMRKKLVSAWQRGLGQLAQTGPLNAAFPLATTVNKHGIHETAVDTRPSVSRELSVSHLNESDQAEALLVEAAEGGRCGCWIRNTVDDAIEAYERIREKVSNPDKVLLFHSRFVMADRQAIETAALNYFGKNSRAEDRAGRILIGTQVLEQSLDICMDVMVSDLAPVDLLIQRAGRLQRHVRDSDGNPLNALSARDERPEPTLHVLAPSLSQNVDKDWIRRFLPGTAAVYKNHGQLWLTLKTLLQQGAIRMPQEARLLVESVYADDVDEAIPEPLKMSYFDQEGERQSQVAMGQFNKLDLDKGYVTSSAMGGWQDEVDIGTRLSDEPSVKVTLVTLDSSGAALVPWIESGRHRWEMSQLSLRQSLAKKLPEWPAELEMLREVLIKEKPALQYSQLWLDPFDSGDFNYNSQVGLTRTITQ